MKRPGVYAIQNLVTGRTYIGSTSSLFLRWNSHRTLLRIGEHHSPELQADWDCYGESAFVFEPLEYIEDQETRILVEQHHIDRLDNPYNANKRAGSGPKDGYTHSVESRRKMSVALNGKVRTAEMRERYRQAKLGTSLTPEHRAAIGAGGTGKKRSAETRAKISAALKGHACTCREAISAAKRGIPNPKHSAAMKGRPWSAKRRAMFEASRLRSEV